MAVYFDYEINAPSLAKHALIACHSHFGLVAVGSINEPDAGGAITLYLDEVGPTINIILGNQGAKFEYLCKT